MDKKKKRILYRSIWFWAGVLAICSVVGLTVIDGEWKFIFMALVLMGVPFVLGILAGRDTDADLPALFVKKED